MRDSYVALNKSVKDAFNALLLKETVMLQDSFFNFCNMKGIDSISDQIRIEYLKYELGFSNEEIEDYKKLIDNNKKTIQEIVDKVNKDVGSKKVIIRDISELESMRDKTNLHNYDTEMFLRWNYAAATDQVRMYMLLEHGGIYADLDMMPAYSPEITKIIYDVGGDAFFENLQIRRSISDIVLKLVTDSSASSRSISIEEIAKEVDMSKISAEEKRKLSQLIGELQKFSKSHEKKDLFAKMSSDVIRDFMPILQRYHKWEKMERSRIEWLNDVS
ncbi:glycosyltransferase sugar-binding region containing DXD motif family protein [Chlamydia psittaci VS225]|nr:glycosyltransferase sugar-binding region containing DXD motif family protein [Chlamydia psittaci VS225]